MASDMRDVFADYRKARVQRVRDEIGAGFFGYAMPRDYYTESEKMAMKAPLMKQLEERERFDVEQDWKERDSALQAAVDQYEALMRFRQEEVNQRGISARTASQERMRGMDLAVEQTRLERDRLTKPSELATGLAEGAADSIGRVHKQTTDAMKSVGDLLVQQRLLQADYARAQAGGNDTELNRITAQSTELQEKLASYANVLNAEQTNQMIAFATQAPLGDKGAVRAMIDSEVTPDSTLVEKHLAAVLSNGDATDADRFNAARTLLQRAGMSMEDLQGPMKAQLTEMRDNLQALVQDVDKRTADYVHQGTQAYRLSYGGSPEIKSAAAQVEGALATYNRKGGTDAPGGISHGGGGVVGTVPGGDAATNGATPSGPPGGGGGNPDIPGGGGGNPGAPGASGAPGVGGGLPGAPGIGGGEGGEDGGVDAALQRVQSGSSAQDQLLAAIDTIDRYPDAPRVQTLKRQIMESPQFAEYTKSKGYDRFDPDDVFRAMNQDYRKAYRQRRREFRQVRRAESRTSTQTAQAVPPTTASTLVQGGDRSLGDAAQGEQNASATGPTKSPSQWLRSRK